MAQAQKTSQVVGESHAAIPEMNSPNRVPNRLILCFDGTGNSFQGSESDTNVVKLLSMFNRESPHQLHYYQPGIGTYTDAGGVNPGFFERIRRSITQTIDTAIATTFDAHVMAGYRFLMRYYGTGDRIYIFGFSRGAYTARFLARMVSNLGILSMGNEEMVPFAYKVFQDFEMGKPDKAKALQYVRTFLRTFCRHTLVPENPKVKDSPDVPTGIQIHFVGLFDCVNSVGTFDVGMKSKMTPPPMVKQAEHVRHAVAIDERRVKFKAALLAHEIENENAKADLKEVWFPGNHGDIGGSWPAEPEQDPKNLGWRAWFSRMWSGDRETRGPHDDKTNDPFQLSDFALKWMVDELDLVEKKYKTDGISWNNRRGDFDVRFAKAEHQEQAITARIHDTMKVGRGSTFTKAILWKLMEFLPFMRRWEIVKGRWEIESFKPNLGFTRDIPEGAKFHRSVIDRMIRYRSKQEPSAYRPKNQIDRTDGQGVTELGRVDPKGGDTSDTGVPSFVVSDDDEYNKKDPQADRIYVLK